MAYYQEQQQQQQQQPYYGDQHEEGPPPRQWLDDRINGQSKYGDQERPPLPCCWVPPMVGWWPGLLETNFCCRWIGWVGCFPSEMARSWCLNTSLILNLCGCLLTAYACIAISDDYLLLSKSSFQKLTVTNAKEPETQPVELFLGLKAAALNNQVSGVGQITVPYDQFCNLVGDGAERYLDPSDCNKCDEISTSLVILIMISVTLFIPTFFSEILRLYSGYDSNCAKGYVTGLGILTLLLNLTVILGFVWGCGEFFYDGQVFFDANGNVLPSSTNPQSSSIAFDTRFASELGYGLIALITGTA
eukprot:CAMPEP_0113504428 /NCGR_PEP_ID=MMETSP0014_2-20120614/34710_1 /TAXON_ID=2857 /ORGANISM="Nitzschia sp." /LENGTH=302 /DNA_ID=CAMNT_0000399537 /DNA_START=140 /DNA_END=1044 /DNA_ORIENTATION=+ /assembly_acc=CAM_ASM_000159